MRRTVLAMAMVVGTAAPAWACGGLIAPNGAIGLVKTSTLAAYHEGVEHYVTQFEFAGAKGEFGSIVPLPGVPSKVRKGGGWTLERLAIEVQPPVVADFAAASESATASKDAVVLEEKRIGALDVTILQGGGVAVGRWAEDNGFDLSPDSPEVLDFYARRSQIFMAAKFDAGEAAERGLQQGEGTSIHLSIPTDHPWVPLRILGLGQSGEAVIEADVFLLTPQEPALLPGPPGSGSETEVDGLLLERSEPASEALLADLGSDRGMRWLPSSDVWFSYLKVQEEASDLTYDLAIDVEGGEPSMVDAGLTLGHPAQPSGGIPWGVIAIVGAVGILAGVVLLGRQAAA